MQELLNTEPLTLLLLLSPVFVVMLVLVLLIVRQRRKINTLEEQLKPKYGFLGKPLYSIFALAVLSFAVSFSFLSTQQPSDVDTVGATVEVGAIINYNVGDRSGSGYEVALYAWPIINGERWGTQPGEEFDVFWEATGPTSFLEVELGVSEDRQSGFTKFLQPGEYEVKVSVFHPEDDFEITVIVNIP